MIVSPLSNDKETSTVSIGANGCSLLYLFAFPLHEEFFLKETVLTVKDYRLR